MLVYLINCFRLQALVTNINSLNFMAITLLTLPYRFLDRNVFHIYEITPINLIQNLFHVSS